MKALVTGGSGFLGSHVADALTKAGHEVVLFDLHPSPWASEGQTTVLGDITDPASVMAAAQGCDVIYHLAAVADIGVALNNPRDAVSVNIMGTLNVLEAARELGIKRFMFASSIYVYSSHGGFYRTTKQACELLVGDYQERYGLPYTILRFGSLYGPRATDSNAVYRMLRQALSDGSIDYSGTGKEIREYIHVHDAASSSVEALADEYQNEIVHLMGRERITTGEMMEMIREMLGGKVELHLQGKHQTGHYIQTPYSFTPKLGKKLVRHTYIDLGLGLLDCVENIHRDLMQEA